MKADDKRVIKKESLKKFRNLNLTLLDEFPALIWRSGKDAKCDYFNKTWLEFTGRTLEQEWGDGWAKGVHPDDFQRCLDIYLSSFQARRPFEMEYRLRRHDGEYRWILDLGRPIKDRHGNFSGFLGACYDITERKIAEEGLRRYRILSERARDIMLFVDTEGNIIEANEAAIRAYGYTREELLALKIYDLRKEDKKAFIQKQMAQADKKGILFETVHYRKDGSLFPVEVNSQGTMIDGKGVLLSVVRDITEREKSRQELEKAREAAEAASLAKSEFLANMSHEIRTPMNGIIGLGELLSVTPLNKEQREYLDMITLSSNTLLKIINDILDFSKIEAGKLEIEEIDFDFRDTLEKTVDAFALRAHEKGLELSCFIHDDVPDYVCGDPGRLRQVLVNLVGNALKFTNTGEVTVIVKKVRDDSARILVKITVVDTGVGIAADKMEYIFKSFTQADGSYTRKFGGTGLGLSISRKLVEMMGGKISVTSKVGTGSAFSFTLPFLAAREERVSQTADLESRLAKLKGSRVLVVDDNETNRKILFHMLQGCGIAVELAAGGEEGIELIKRFNDKGTPFNVILLDAQMPVMNGFTFAERIKAYIDIKTTAIIMLTSVGIKGDLARCQKMGISVYLVKPIKKHDLFQAIATVSIGAEKEALLQPGVDAAGENREKTAGFADSLKNVKILLAEDNYINNKLTTAMLKNKGWQVKTVPNGVKALKAIENHAFDLILMDIQMPEMDGLEATRIIRAKEKETGNYVPIVAMTAYAMKEDWEKFLESGMDDYISKPIHSAELYQIIERLLRREKKALGKSGLQAGLARMLAVLSGNKQEVRELIDDFLEDSEKQTERLYKAIWEDNAADVERMAHGLKGAILNFKTGIEYDLANELELIGRSGYIDRARALAIFEDLQVNLEILKVQLKEYAAEDQVD